MRALLILAVLLPLMVVFAWYVSRPILRRRQSQRHIAELEAENARLDAIEQLDAVDAIELKMLDRLDPVNWPTVRGGEREHFGRRTEDPR